MSAGETWFALFVGGLMLYCLAHALYWTWQDGLLWPTIKVLATCAAATTVVWWFVV